MCYTFIVRVRGGNMAQMILNTIITFILSSVLGYCISLIKSYKNKLNEKHKNETMQNMALLTLLKGNLTNTYFVYNELKQIPDYVYQNFLDALTVYENLGGNGFIHNIAKKMETWEIVKTGVLVK